MNEENISAKKIIEHLECHHEKSIKKTDQLNDVLINLRYEGKVSFGKNLKTIDEVVSFYDKELVHHIKLEKEIIFPFLTSHIPKLECVLNLLEGEHGDIGKNIRDLKSLSDELNRTKENVSRAKIIEKIMHTGTYFIFLVRHHIQAERESIYMAIKEELHENETKNLYDRICKMSCMERK